MERPSSPSKFDEYAESYTKDMQENVALSGESYQYFLDYKVHCLERLGLARHTAVLDYGCGIGSLTRCLVQHFERVEGYDPSTKSIEVASERIPDARFHSDPATIADAHFGAAVVSGVLHHVFPHERVDLLRTLRKKLAPRGRLVIFEHNPLNPLTRRAVQTCPFDGDARLISPRALRELAGQAGFSDVKTRYIVFFPHLLRALRPLEPYLSRCFLGAQTMTTGTNP